MSFFDDKINIPQIPEITFQGVMEALTEKRK